MSNQSNSFSSPLNNEIVQSIDLLNLTIIQKQHVRLLAHCLSIFTTISDDDITPFEEENVLREWCKNQSQKFNDEKFNELLYEQMSSAAYKLKDFSQSIGKNLTELNIQDLAILVQKNSEKLI